MVPRVSRRDAWLLVVFAALLGVWWYLPRSEDALEAYLVDWSDLAEDAASRIVFRRGTESVVLERRGDATQRHPWVAVNRQQLPADPAVVDRILHDLEHLEIARLLTRTSPSYDLDRPQLVIEVSHRTGLRRLSIGADAVSPSGARYAVAWREGQERALVLGPGSARALDVPLDTVLDHRVTDWVPSELRSIAVTTPTGAFRLNRESDGHYLLLDGTSTQRARRDTAEAVAIALTELSFTRFSDAGVAARDLGSRPQLEVTLTARRDSQESHLRVRIGGRCSIEPPTTDAQPRELALVVDGSSHVTGCTDPERVQRLSAVRADLIDDALFSLHPDEVERLEASATKLHMTLDRAGSAFELKGEPPTPVTLRAGNHLLASLTALRGAVMGRCDFGAAARGTTLSLRSAVLSDERPTFERIAWPVPSGSTEAAEEPNAAVERLICRDDGVALRLGDAASALLAVDPSALRDPVLVDVPIEAIRQVTLVSSIGRQVLAQAANGSVNVVEPAQFNSDAAVVESLREHLAQLTVASFLPNLHPETTTLTRLATVEWNLDAQAKHRLQLFSDANDRVIGWLDADKTAFALDPGWLELVDGWLVDRSALRLTEGDEQVKLLRRTDTILLRRAGSSHDAEWAIEGAAAAGATAADAVLALGQLRALSVQAWPNSNARLTAAGRTTALGVEYASPSAKAARLRVDIGASTLWHHQRVRVVTLRGGRYAWLVREADLASVLALAGVR
jgi:hypothetical protein